MTSRGEVGLIVASVGIGLQALPASAFAGAGVEGPSLVSLIVVVARMLLFFVIAWALGSRFIPRSSS